MALPFELRVTIWKYLFRDNSVLLSNTHLRGYTLPRQQGTVPARRQRAGILATCKRCYHEIRPVFLSMTRFRIDRTEAIPGRMLQEVGRFLPLNKIQYLMIGPACWPDATFSRLIRNIDKYFPNLVSLHIRVALLPAWVRTSPLPLKRAIERNNKFHFRDGWFVTLLRAALKDRRRRSKGKCSTTLVYANRLYQHGEEYSEWPGPVVAWIDLHEWQLRISIMGEVYEANFEAL